MNGLEDFGCIANQFQWLVARQTYGANLNLLAVHLGPQAS